MRLRDELCHAAWHLAAQEPCVPSSDPPLLESSEQVFFPWLSLSLPKGAVTGLAGQIGVSEPWRPGEPPRRAV